MPDATNPRTASAARCWSAWQSDGLGPHDGKIRKNHPVLKAILSTQQSPSSLSKLAKDPLAFVWRYGLGWDEADPHPNDLILNARAWGNVIHEVLEETIASLEVVTTIAQNDDEKTRKAIEHACDTVQRRWREMGTAPTEGVWSRSIERAAAMAAWVLKHGPTSETTAKSVGEVPWGEQRARKGKRDTTVAIPALRLERSGITVGGYIDRADYDANGHPIRVIDYKSGRSPGAKTQINGGRELQRCLYTAALRAASEDPKGPFPDAWIIYVREGRCAKLENPEAALETIDTGLRAAREALERGDALPGPDAGKTYDPLAFALPADATRGYEQRKEKAIKEALAELAPLWDAR